MKRMLARNLGFICLIPLMLSLPACAGPASQQASVEHAYQTANLVTLPPYKRSIFSTTDF